MQQLVDQLARLPGIGKRSAERVVFYLLCQPTSEAEGLAEAVLKMKSTVLQCGQCCNFSESDPCPICADSQRDRTTVLVVEEPKDVIVFEHTGMYRGLYHVLMGRLAPLEGIGPGALTIDPLVRRVKNDGVREIILGTTPTLEGDGTALHLQETLASLGVTVTRLARGLPTGTPLDFVSKAVLGDAIHSRRRLGE